VSFIIISTISLLGKIFLPNACASDSTAILINGGDAVQANGCDFYNDLHRMQHVLKGWNQVEFAADGDQPILTPNGTACKLNSLATPYDSRGFAVMKRYQEPGSKEASEDNLQQEILKTASGTNPPKTLLLYFTDHGAEGEVELWGQALTADHLKSLIAQIPPQTQLILVHDHCMSASMLESLFTVDGHVRPHSCGFAAAASTEYSMTSQSIARNMDERPPSKTFPRSDRILSQTLKSMTLDPTIQSTPTTSSDIYLAKYLQHHPASASCETCLNGGALDALLQNFDAQTKQVANLLLVPELQSINEEASRAFNAAKVSPDTSLTAVQTKVKATQTAFHNADTASDQAYDRLKPAVIDFITENLGKQKFDQYLQMDKKLDALRDQLEFEIDPAKRQSLTNQIQELEPKYADLNFQVDRIQSTLDQDDPKDFKNFVALGAQKNEWAPNVYNAYENAGERATKISNQEKPILNLANILTKKEALNKIISSGDTPAILEYLGILECENTDVHQNS
jgi:Peptidase C13 family